MVENNMVNPSNPKIAIVIHAFYAPQLQVIAQKVADILEVCQQYQLNISIDVHVTLPSNSEAGIKNILVTQLPEAIIHHCDSFGMDLWPFFQLINRLQDYQWVLKLHTKNTKTSANQVWFDSLIYGLVGNPDVFLSTVALLQENPDWVMAGLMPFYVSAQQLMLNNKSNVNKLIKLWQLENIDVIEKSNLESKDWGFFAGSLYWLRPCAFLSAAEQLQQHPDWFRQDYAMDGQMAHAVERLITRVATCSGSIGLLLPSGRQDQTHTTVSLLSYTHRHPLAINNVFMKQLLHSYGSLSDSLNILTNTDLLDVPTYSQQVDVNFENVQQAYQHFLLIGQFNGYAGNVLPIALKQKSEQLIDWQAQQTQVNERQSDLVSIIIPVLNNLKLTIACLRSIEKYTRDCTYEVIIVDNGSRRFKSIFLSYYVRSMKNATVYHMRKNLNFSIACNYGFSKSNGATVIFLNNDTQVTANWLQPLLQSLSSPDNIAVQPKLLYFDNTIQCAGIVFADDGFGVCRFEGASRYLPQANQSQSCPALTGACLAISATSFATVKGFDAWFINGQEDIDLCLRLTKTFEDKQLWYDANSEVYHHTYKSQGRRKKINQNRAVFKARWQLNS